MMKKTALGFALGMVAILVSACSGEAPQPTPSKNATSPAPSGSRAGGANDGDDDDDNAPAACVTKADKGNTLGVGAYCDKQTRCKTGHFCTADFGAPAGAHFCTVICATDADCGAGAVCFEETRGKGCIPNACVK